MKNAKRNASYVKASGSWKRLNEHPTTSSNFILMARDIALEKDAGPDLVDLPATATVKLICFLHIQHER